MLFNIENINVIDSKINSVEMAILSAKYQDIMTQVLWCGISILPTEGELNDIISICLLTLNKSENPIILHFEDVSERKLETPALPMIQHIISVLVTEKQTIKNCIKCSIFQAKKLDNVTKTIRDLFLSLYIPIRPLIVTDDTGAIENFVGTIVSSC